MTTLTVTSREIARMLAGGDDPERLRRKMARLNGWTKAGLFECLNCGAVNPGVGRGGALEYPAAAKAYAALFDELADGGASGYEITLLVGFFPIEEMQTGTLGRAMRGEAGVWLFWRMLAEGQVPIERQFSATPSPPTGWISYRAIDLTGVFARARE